MKFYLLDKNKFPVSCKMQEWATRLDAHRIIKRTNLNDDKTLISTVFLGVDHRFMREGKPILWETMVFCEDEKINNYMVRATSNKQALKNHYRVFSALRNNHLNNLKK